MKENKFIIAESKVFYILNKYAETRKSDQLLYLKYWQLTDDKVPFDIFFTFPHLFSGHSFKTIERCRRKIQADHPELKDKETDELRKEAEKEYEQYSIDMLGGL